MSVTGALVAFSVAFVVAAVELITTHYPRTWFLLLNGHTNPKIKRSFALYAYALIYGLIAFFATLGLEGLVSSGTIKLEGLGVSNELVRAAAVGIATKALLHINLFTVKSGTQSMPIGIETLVQLFEPLLLRTILLNEFEAVRAYVLPRASKAGGLAKVKTDIKNNIPPTLPTDEKSAIENEVDKAADDVVAMERFFRLAGKQIFDRVFPS